MFKVLGLCLISITLFTGFLYKNNEIKEISYEIVDSSVKPIEINKKETNIELIKKVEEKKVSAIITTQPTAKAPKEEIKQEEKLLKEITVVIDAGHQQKGNNKQEKVSPTSTQTKAKVSSGTRGVSTGKYEYELNLEVALKLRDKLKSAGANVVMIREANDVDISNAQRAIIANENNANVVIRIHADGSDNKNVNGYSILIPGNKSISDEKVVSDSKQIAVSVSESMKKTLDSKFNGIVTRNDLTGFNWLKVPGILIEMGFMTNIAEDNKMSTEKFQNNIVSAIYDGLVEYYNNN